MLQVCAHPFVIPMRILKTEMLGNSGGDDSEEIAHRLEGFPGPLVAGIGIGVLEHCPVRWRKVSL